jgi:hypothetical protein
MIKPPGYIPTVDPRIIAEANPERGRKLPARNKRKRNLEDT